MATVTHFPRRMTIVGDFFVRGGIHTVVTAAYEARKKRR
jgi:NADPH-dependent 7-cyano-7-deazaguanine reductase QueF